MSACAQSSRLDNETEAEDYCNLEEDTESTLEDSENSDSDRDNSDELSVCDNSSQNADMLYAGAKITLSAFMLLLALFTTKYSLVGDGIQDLLSLFAIAKPSDNKLRTSLYSFKSYFKNLKNPLVKQFYCDFCCFDMEKVPFVLIHYVVN